MLRKPPLPLLQLPPESACSCVSARAACSLGEQERKEKRKGDELKKEGKKRRKKVKKLPPLREKKK